MSPARVPWLVAAVVFALDLRLAAPGLTWLDGGELALAAAAMAVPHPPGEPAWLTLARLAAYLPLGDLPFRLTVFGAATAAAAAGLLAALVARALGGSGGPEAGRPAPGEADAPGRAQAAVIGGVAGLAFGCSPALVLQAVRPELYALAALLGLLAVGAIHGGGRRGPALALLPLCVAGAVHHAMLVAAAPGLVVLAWGRGRGSLRAAAAAAAFLLPTGLLQFAWLPLRASADPPVEFGAPRTLSRVLWSVTAQGYGRSFHLDEGQFASNLRAHLDMAVSDLGLLALVLAAAGCAWILARSPRSAVASGLILAVGVLPTALQGVFYEANPDARGYLLGPVAVLCAAAAAGVRACVHALRARAPRMGPAVLGALAAALTITPLRASVGRSDASGTFAPSLLAAAILEEALPGSVLLPGGDSFAFPTLYARYWEGRRPDVHVVPLHVLEPAAFPALRRRGFPVPEPLAGDAERGSPSGFRRASPERALRAWLAADPEAPLLVNDVFLPPDIERRRRERGLFFLLSRSGDADPVAEFRSWYRYFQAAGRDSRWAADSVAGPVLSRRYAARAGWMRAQGRAEAARELLRSGRFLERDPSAMIQLMAWRMENGLEPVSPQAGSGAAPVGPWDAAFERGDDAAALENLGARSGADPDLLSLRAAAALMLGRFPEAAGDVRAVREAQPSHPRALLLAERLYSLGMGAPAEPRTPPRGPAAGARRP